MASDADQPMAASKRPPATVAQALQHAREAGLERLDAQLVVGGVLAQHWGRAAD